MAWDPATYNQFQVEREAPFEDLAALIDVKRGLRVIDLGCGTGALTDRLAMMLPGSDVLGVDSSAEMLAIAPPERAGLRFKRGGIEDVDGAWDLVFSHAALQWLDDHETLIPGVFDLVAPGGQLAVQVPSNHDHPTHTILATIASEEPFREALGGWCRVSPVLRIEQYAAILHRLGAERIVVLEKVYAQVLADGDALAAWAAGTAMTPYIARLPNALHRRFETRYREALGRAFPDAPVFYPFKRILLAANNPT